MFVAISEAARIKAVLLSHNKFCIAAGQRIMAVA